jgi:hypothetical protein
MKKQNGELSWLSVPLKLKNKKEVTAAHFLTLLAITSIAS